MTDVTIINLALIKQGISLEAITRTQNAKPIRNINRVYDVILAAMIESFVLYFSIARAALAQVDVDPLYEWSCVYTLPGDCVFLLEVEYLSSGEYVVEGRDLLCNVEGGVNIKYCSGTSAADDFSSLFCNAFAARLAYETAWVNTGSKDIRDRLEKEVPLALGMALTHSAKHGREPKKPDSTYITARSL